jgi:hypothetical protein
LSAKNCAVVDRACQNIEPGLLHLEQFAFEPPAALDALAVEYRRGAGPEALSDKM